MYLNREGKQVQYDINPACGGTLRRTGCRVYLVAGVILLLWHHPECLPQIFYGPVQGFL